MKIITLPQYESTLRTPSADLKAELISSAQNQKFFDELAATMFSADGAGLAAPQVAKPIRVAAINLDATPLIIINPRITKKSWRTQTLEEGCLSIPGVYGQVKRYKKITLKYLDRQGQPQTAKFKDMAARIIQHEIDHLDGVLFIDKVVK